MRSCLSTATTATSLQLFSTFQGNIYSKYLMLMEGTGQDTLQGESEHNQSPSIHTVIWICKLDYMTWMLLACKWNGEYIIHHLWGLREWPMDSWWRGSLRTWFSVLYGFSFTGVKKGQLEPSSLQRLSKRVTRAGYKSHKYQCSSRAAAIIHPSIHPATVSISCRPLAACEQCVCV